MDVHISIDDVIYSFMELDRKKPISVFDISFFEKLRELNYKYGVVFTLYVFENYAESFFIKDISYKYWEEIENAGFIKIGFHGTFNSTDYNTFKGKCQTFYSVVPISIRTETLRLHEYRATEGQINLLKTYGMRNLLCRENESRKNGKFPPSYDLIWNEEYQLQKGNYYKNGVNYIITNIRIEFYDIITLKKIISSYINTYSSKSLIIYTHDGISDCLVNLESVCQLLSKYDNINYIF